MAETLREAVRIPDEEQVDRLVLGVNISIGDLRPGLPTVLGFIQVAVLYGSESLRRGGEPNIVDATGNRNAADHFPAAKGIRWRAVGRGGGWPVAGFATGE